MACLFTLAAAQAVGASGQVPAFGAAPVVGSDTTADDAVRAAGIGVDVNAAAASPATAASAVVAAAASHLGAPYRLGGTGPRYFDCSGLVFRVFADTGNLWRIGGSRKTAAGYTRYLEARGRAATSGAVPGDLVVYGRGSHIGIYVGGGQVISALIHGVKKTAVHALTVPFTEYLHTRLAVPKPAAAPLPTRITTRAAALRRYPRFGTQMLERVPAGTKFTVLGSRTDATGTVWLRSKVPDGTIGWIRKSLTRRA
jgi:peptidoglycan DL-endopeptidase CwlO